jgi:hypothetical protein
MTTDIDSLLLCLTSRSFPEERCMVADALEDVGRLSEASTLRSRKPILIRADDGRARVCVPLRNLRHWRGRRVDCPGTPLHGSALVESRWSSGQWGEITAIRSLRVRNHSPNGFEWGYSGSGPAQLALALLLLVSPRPRALAYYQRLKTEIVARWPKSGWELSEEELIRWIDQQPSLPFEREDPERSAEDPAPETTGRGDYR